MYIIIIFFFKFDKDWSNMLDLWGIANLRRGYRTQSLLLPCPQTFERSSHINVHVTDVRQCSGDRHKL